MFSQTILGLASIGLISLFNSTPLLAQGADQVTFLVAQGFSGNRRSLIERLELAQEVRESSFVHVSRIGIDDSGGLIIWTLDPDIVQRILTKEGFGGITLTRHDWAYRSPATPISLGGPSGLGEEQLNNLTYSGSADPVEKLMWIDSKFAEIQIAKDWDLSTEQKDKAAIFVAWAIRHLNWLLEKVEEVAGALPDEWPQDSRDQVRSHLRDRYVGRIASSLNFAASLLQSLKTPLAHEVFLMGKNQFFLNERLLNERLSLDERRKSKSYFEYWLGLIEERVRFPGDGVSNFTTNQTYPDLPNLIDRMHGIPPKFGEEKGNLELVALDFFPEPRGPLGYESDFSLSALLVLGQEGVPKEVVDAVVKAIRKMDKEAHSKLSRSSLTIGLGYDLRTTHLASYPLLRLIYGLQIGASLDRGGQVHKNYKFSRDVFNEQAMKIVSELLKPGKVSLLHRATTIALRAAADALLEKTEPTLIEENKDRTLPPSLIRAREALKRIILSLNGRECQSLLTTQEI